MFLIHFLYIQSYFSSTLKRDFIYSLIQSYLTNSHVNSASFLRYGRRYSSTDFCINRSILCSQTLKKMLFFLQSSQTTPHLLNFQYFHIPNQSYVKLLNSVKIANSAHLEQYKFKSDEKDKTLALFHPFFGLLWVYLLMKC